MIEQWQIDQGKRCGCRGTDEYCVCQNVRQLDDGGLPSRFTGTVEQLVNSLGELERSRGLAGAISGAAIKELTRLREENEKLREALGCQADRIAKGDPVSREGALQSGPEGKQVGLTPEEYSEFWGLRKRAAQCEWAAEELECLHMTLDDRGVPRSDDAGTFSLVGRVNAYAAALRDCDCHLHERQVCDVCRIRVSPSHVSGLQQAIHLLSNFDIPEDWATSGDFQEGWRNARVAMVSALRTLKAANAQTPIEERSDEVSAAGGEAGLTHKTLSDPHQGTVDGRKDIPG